MAINFRDVPSALNDPIADGFVISPHDTNPLPKLTRAIYVGGDGDIKLELKGGTTLVYKGLKAGTMLPVRARVVLATGTTASNLLGQF